MSYKSIGKPIIIKTPEEKTRLEKILNPPEKPMLTLDIYMELVQNEYKALEEEFKQIERDLNTLKNDEKIKKYLQVLDRYKALKEALLSKKECERKVQHKIEKHYKCPHPLYAVKKHSSICILCHRPHKYDGIAQTSPELLENLINEKKLIANVTSYLDTREWPTPIYIPEEIELFQNIVDFYSVLYDSREELESYGIVNKNHSLEDLVWEHYMQKRQSKTKKYERGKCYGI